MKLPYCSFCLQHEEDVDLTIFILLLSNILQTLKRATTALNEPYRSHIKLYRSQNDPYRAKSMQDNLSKNHIKMVKKAYRIVH